MSYVTPTIPYHTMRLKRRRRSRAHRINNIAYAGLVVGCAATATLMGLYAYARASGQVESRTAREAMHRANAPVLPHAIPLRSHPSPPSSSSSSSSPPRDL